MRCMVEELERDAPCQGAHGAVVASYRDKVFGNRRADEFVREVEAGIIRANCRVRQPRSRSAKISSRTAASAA